jgi:hypothetical protein
MILLGEKLYFIYAKFIKQKNRPYIKGGSFSCFVLFEGNSHKPNNNSSTNYLYCEPIQILYTVRNLLLIIVFQGLQRFPYVQKRQLELYKAHLAQVQKNDNP